MISHRVSFSRSPGTVRRMSVTDEFVRESAPVARQATRDDAEVDPPPGQPAADDASLLQAIQAMVEQVDELEQRRRQSIGELRELAIELACAMTRHVVDGALADHSFPLQRLIDQAIEHLGISQPAEVTIKLHPQDLQAIEQAWRAASADAASSIALQPDPALSRGSCEASVADQGVLIDVHDQLNRIRHELLGSLDHAETERRDAARNNQIVQRYPNRRDTA